MTPYALTLSALALAPGAGEPIASEQVVAAADYLAVALEEDGVSLGEVHRLLTAAGARAEVIRAEPDALESLPAPSILVLQSRHCVVLDGFDREAGNVRVFEPATSKGYIVRGDAIRQAWTGEAIVCDEPRLPRWKFYATAAAAMVLVLGAAALARLAVRRLVPY
jgi:ABC-type bacteriocin/lantibiotic exporter with double-glycine peptidase domain